MHTEYIHDFLIALFITTVTETTLLVLLIRFLFKDAMLQLSRIIFAGMLASFATLPYLWFVLPKVILPYTYFFIIGEISVFMIEACIYYFVLQLSIKKALTVSFFCNSVSMSIGILYYGC
jgi:hypothetical protein